MIFAREELRASMVGLSKAPNAATNPVFGPLTDLAEEGWDKVELVLRAGFRFFADNPSYVRLVRREAIDGGPPIPGESPTHGNYLTLLHTQRSPGEARAQAMRFRDEARRLGAALVRPLG